MDEKTGDEKPQGDPAGPHDVASEQFRAQLDQMAQVFSKNLPASNAYLTGGLPFPLPFPNVSLCLLFDGWGMICGKVITSGGDLIRRYLTQDFTLKFWM